MVTGNEHDRAVGNVNVACGLLVTPGDAHEFLAPRRQPRSPVKQYCQQTQKPLRGLQIAVDLALTNWRQSLGRVCGMSGAGDWPGEELGAY